MLPSILKGPGTIFRNGPEWISYLQCIGEYSDSVDHDFLSSICYEHFDRFNSRFPEFDIDSHKIERVTITAEKILNRPGFIGGSFI